MEHTELPDQAYFENLEKQVWNALVAGDGSADAALLDDGFLGVYSDGFAEKSGHVGQLQNGPTVRQFTMSDVRMATMGSDHVLLSYRADFCRVNSLTDEVMYVSSVWRKTFEIWRNIFSQDTPASD